MNKNLPSGNHFLTVESIKHKGMRVTFVMRPLARGYKIVLRTWTIGSPSFEGACLKFGTKEVIIDPDKIRSFMAGRLIWGEIGPAKNPIYVDLKRIISVPKEFPAKEVMLYLKRFNESSYSENTNDDVRP